MLRHDGHVPAAADRPAAGDVDRRERHLRAGVGVGQRRLEPRPQRRRRRSAWRSSSARSHRRTRRPRGPRGGGRRAAPSGRATRRASPASTQVCARLACAAMVAGLWTSADRSVDSADARLPRPLPGVPRRIRRARPGRRDVDRRPPLRRALARRDRGRPGGAARVHRPLAGGFRRPAGERSHAPTTPSIATCASGARGDAVRRDRAARRRLGPAALGVPAGRRPLPAPRPRVRAAGRSARRRSRVGSRACRAVPDGAAVALVGPGDGRPVGRFQTEKALEQLPGIVELIDEALAAAEAAAPSDPAVAELRPRLAAAADDAKAALDGVRTPPTRRRPAARARATAAWARTCSPARCGTRCAPRR